MTEHRLEVADVVREHQEEFLAQWGHTVSPQQHKALRDIGACRTPALGGHLEQCDRCGHSVIAYDSCRNRHCPKCQFSARERWLNERAKELLPAPYFHLVFTLPPELAPLALQNQKFIYNLLFRAAAETLLEIAADRKHLGARIGFLAVRLRAARARAWRSSFVFHCSRTPAGVSRRATSYRSFTWEGWA